MLPLVFLIGGVTVLIGFTLAFLAHVFVVNSFGFQISERAKAVAASGVYDALLRLDRNKDLSGSYTLPLDGNSTDVTIVQDTPAVGMVSITSISTISSRQRKIRAVVSRSPDTGQIALRSWVYAQ